jgi:hypothetical protein
LVRLLLFAISGLVVLLHAGSARAEDRARKLEIEAAPEARSCADAVVLRSKIGERLGRDPFSDDEGEPLHLRIAFGKNKRTWTAEIALVDAKGARIGGRSLEHEGATCDPLITSVVFTVAVLLEDLAPRPTPPPPPPPAPEPPPPPEKKPEPPPPPPPEHDVHFDAALGPVVSLGGAPATSVGGEALLGLDVDRLRVELAGRAHLPASSEADVGVRARMAYGRLAPCYGWVVASACAVVAIGSVSAEAIGDGITASRSESQLYAAAGLGAVSRLLFAGDRLFVRLSADLLFALSRAGFDVGDRRVWTVPTVGAAGAIGVGVRFR